MYGIASFYSKNEIGHRESLVPILSCGDPGILKPRDMTIARGTGGQGSVLTNQFGGVAHSDQPGTLTRKALFLVLLACREYR